MTSLVLLSISGLCLNAPTGLTLKGILAQQEAWLLNQIWDEVVTNTQPLTMVEMPADMLNSKRVSIQPGFVAEMVTDALPVT